MRAPGRPGLLAGGLLAGALLVVCCALGPLVVVAGIGGALAGLGTASGRSPVRGCRWRSRAPRSSCEDAAPRVAAGRPAASGALRAASLGRDDATAMSAPPSEPRCRRQPLRLPRERVRRVLSALRLSRGRRCESRPDWLDDDGLAGVLVPRRPRGPRPGGAVALQRPVADGPAG